MNSVRITVFTPAYNRAYTLHKCYESLKRQTNPNFIWLIIDDGSTDNTEQLVRSWIDENEIQIRYYKQENQGMHGAHNTAYQLIDTELNVCIDSDDYMTDNAIELILTTWDQVKAPHLAGILALDSYENGQIIGTLLPTNIKECTYFDTFNKYKVKGDKKLVYRSDLTKNYPYPLFEGERYVGLGYKSNKIDENYTLYLLNEVLCVVEYMEDGSSKNMLSQYRNNPKGFSFLRIENMQHPTASLSYKFRSCIHYVSSSFICKNKDFLKQSPCKFLTIVAIPFGYCLYRYIMKNTVA